MTQQSTTYGSALTRQEQDEYNVSFPIFQIYILIYILI